MNYGLYLSAAGLQAQQTRQSVLANNLANAQTAGFKRDLAVMRSRANAVDEDPRMSGYRLPVVQDQGGGVFATNGGIDLTQADFRETGIKTDLALSGRGFFTVQGDQAGQKLLTRDGRFLINQEGTLVTAVGGRPVLSASGEPIKLNPELKMIVNDKGQITQGDSGQENGIQLGLVDVASSRSLIKLGGNVMRVDQDSSLTQVPTTTGVRQGSYEVSGVDPVYEMVNMMEGMRAFEANARMITYQDQTMQQLNQIGRVA